MKYIILNCCIHSRKVNIFSCGCSLEQPALGKPQASFEESLIAMNLVSVTSDKKRKRAPQLNIFAFNVRIHHSSHGKELLMNFKKYRSRFLLVCDPHSLVLFCSSYFMSGQED